MGLDGSSSCDTLTMPGDRSFNGSAARVGPPPGLISGGLLPGEELLEERWKKRSGPRGCRLMRHGGLR